MGHQPTLRILLDSAGTYDAEIKACEVAVMGPRYGDTEEFLLENYGAYADQTHMLGVHHSEHGVIAFARIIVPGPVELYTFPEIAKEPWGIDVPAMLDKLDMDPQNTWDISTFGARGDRQAASRWSALALYYGVFQALKANDIPNFVGLLDSTVRRVMLAMGITFETIPGTGPQYYLGSPDCTPVYMNVEATMTELRRRNPEVYGCVADGRIPGLVPVDPATMRLPGTARLDSSPSVIDLAQADVTSGSGSASPTQ